MGGKCLSGNKEANVFYNSARMTYGCACDTASGKSWVFSSTLHFTGKRTVWKPALAIVVFSFFN